MYKQCLSVVAGLLAAAAFALSPGTASAQHHHGGGGGGGWHGGGGSWHGGGWGGNHGGYYGRGWGGVSIGIGYPWYGYGGYGYYRGYGYRPYYYGGSDVYYDTTPYYYGAMPYDYDTPVYGDVTAPSYSYGSTAAPDNAARIRVVVPPDAQVWFDDRMTQQTGSVRSFESPALTPGRDFSYDVKARWRGRDGKDVTQTRHVDVRANANVTVDFTRPAQ
jgi:uncharacterized protein (TIGR03000 family)